MEDEILRKLKEILEKPIKSEYQVVYIMVAIRKLLDKVDRKGQQYPLLRFYCSWVLHPKIDRLSPVRDILNRIAEEHKEGERGKTNLDFIKFEHLKEEMIEFFTRKGIPLNLLHDYEKWRIFMVNLIYVLKDCPLELDSKFKPIFVERFVLKDCESENLEGCRSLKVNWEYKLVDSEIIFKSGIEEIDKVKIEKVVFPKGKDGVENYKKLMRNKKENK